MIPRIKNIFSVVFLGMLIGIFTIGFYLYFIENNPPFQSPPFEIIIMPIPVDKEVYSVGENILLNVHACRNSNASYTVYKSFRDGLVYAMPPVERVSGPLGCIEKNVPVEIPKSLPSGEYYLYGRTVYNVNILATRSVEWRSESFRVKGE